MRRRWPSITCSQDLAPTPPSPTALLHHTHHQQQLHHLLVPLQRQQQQHGPGGAGAAWYESASAAAAAAGGLSAGGDVAGVPADAAHPNGMALRPQPSIPETDAFLDAREAFGASSSASGRQQDVMAVGKHAWYARGRTSKANSARFVRFDDAAWPKRTSTNSNTVINSWRSLRTRGALMSTVKRCNGMPLSQIRGCGRCRPG